jgi:hypothetical protein
MPAITSSRWASIPARINPRAKMNSSRCADGAGPGKKNISLGKGWMGKNVDRPENAENFPKKKASNMESVC